MYIVPEYIHLSNSILNHITKSWNMFMTGMAKAWIQALTTVPVQSKWLGWNWNQMVNHRPTSLVINFPYIYVELKSFFLIFFALQLKSLVTKGVRSTFCAFESCFFLRICKQVYENSKSNVAITAIQRVMCRWNFHCNYKLKFHQKWI